MTSKHGGIDFYSARRSPQAALGNSIADGLQQQVANLGHTAADHDCPRIKQIYQTSYRDSKITPGVRDDFLRNQIASTGGGGYIPGSQRFDGSHAGEQSALTLFDGFPSLAGNCFAAC